jgi:hypothetical protein
MDYNPFGSPSGRKPRKNYERRGPRAEGRGESRLRALWLPDGIVAHGTRTRRAALARCKPGALPKLVFIGPDGVAARP